MGNGQMGKNPELAGSSSEPQVQALPHCWRAEHLPPGLEHFLTSELGEFRESIPMTIHFRHVMSFAPFVGAAQTYILRGSWVISSLYQSPSYISIKKLQNKQLTLDSDPYQIVKGVADCTLSTRVLQTNTPVPVKVSDSRWCWFHLQRSWRTPSSELHFYPAQIIREGKGWDQTIFGWIRSIYTLFCTCSQGGMRHLATNVPVNMSKSWECDNLLL